MSQKSFDVYMLLEHLDRIPPEERADVVKTHLAMAWDEGLYFAGDAVRGGCSLTEAAAANPFRKPVGTVHIAEAFEAIQRHEPEWERGFLQHTFMEALNTPGVSLSPLLPQAIVLLPAYLRSQTTPDGVDLQNLLARLRTIANLDQRFLQNFLDGNPCAPFL